ncbi:FkbM family methyltransferase [Gammaproteobacteria bacterium]|nr:FkbM family methyltransferase [Gammaproteobacteria bacterium]
MSLNFKEKKTNIFKNRPDVEQKLVQKFFNSLDSNVKNEEDVGRFFVDVGANDPVIDSQSYHLESLGWKGLLIEPLKEYTDLLKSKRSNKVIQIACSSKKNHDKILDIIVAGVHSTLNAKPIAVGVSSNKTQKVKCKTLDHVLEEHNIQKNFDFLSIDVEGHEMELFDGFSLNYWMPKLIVLEDHVINHEKHNYMKKNNYQLMCRTGLNSWYVPQSFDWHLSLKAKFEFFRKYYLGIIFRKLRYLK